MTVHRDIYGPDWPLGFIEVLAPGTPVRITSLVDPPPERDAPEVSDSLHEYSPSVQQLIFSSFKPVFKLHGLQVNAGMAYVVRAGGDRDDPGTIVLVMEPGVTRVLAAPMTVKNAFSPYRYYVDADVAHDGLFVTALIF